MKIHFSALAIFLIVSVLNLSAEKKGIPYFPWMKDVCAKSFPNSSKNFYVNNFDAGSDVVDDCAETIQNAIENCATNGGGKVSFLPYISFSGSIFINSNVHLEGENAGIIQWTKDWTNDNFSVIGKEQKELVLKRT